MMFSLVILVALVVGCVVVAGFIMAFAATLSSESSNKKSDHEKD